MLAALWRRGPLSPADLIAEVQAARSWAPATIKTLLGRLLRKGLVRSDREGGRHLYRACISRDDYLESEVRQLLDRLFDGRPSALAAFLDRWDMAGRLP